MFSVSFCLASNHFSLLPLPSPRQSLSRLPLPLPLYFSIFTLCVISVFPLRIIPRFAHPSHWHGPYFAICTALHCVRTRYPRRRLVLLRRHLPTCAFFPAKSIHLEPVFSGFYPRCLKHRVRRFFLCPCSGIDCRFILGGSAAFLTPLTGFVVLCG